MPQLWGARGILRINLIQHDRLRRHERLEPLAQFRGPRFNWIMCNNGYHTIHHNRAGLHWSELDEMHARKVKGKIDPSLDEPSMILYLWRTYFARFSPPTHKDVAQAEAQAAQELAPRQERKLEAAEASLTE
jgi:beta-carotene hydroxylase